MTARKASGYQGVSSDPSIHPSIHPSNLSVYHMPPLCRCAMRHAPMPNVNVNYIKCKPEDEGLERVSNAEL